MVEDTLKTNFFEDIFKRNICVLNIFLDRHDFLKTVIRPFYVEKIPSSFSEKNLLYSIDVFNLVHSFLFGIILLTTTN